MTGRPGAQTESGILDGIAPGAVTAPQAAVDPPRRLADQEIRVRVDAAIAKLSALDWQNGHVPKYGVDRSGRS